jgi:hypothetical protein
MAETDLAAWLPVRDAAAAIGCSTRTVERLDRGTRSTRGHIQDGAVQTSLRTVVLVGLCLWKTASDDDRGARCVRR